jgi:nitroreductase
VELIDTVLRRRMTRRFDPDRGVDLDTVTALVELGLRAPSAGFSQGWDFLVLLDAADREAFWAAAADPDPAARDPWTRGVGAAPALILCLSDPTAYLDRYAEPDKGWTDRAVEHWPVPYWDTDVAMAAMIILLGAVDAGLDALFFGVPADRVDAVRSALGIPTDRRVVGVLALGHEAARVGGSASTRRRRPTAEALHVGRFGASGEGPPRG